MKKYSTIIADPPWYQKGGGKIKRGADKHYGIMKEHEIKSVMAGLLDGKVADDAHLYLWAANNHLPEALRIIEHLGFRYITNLVWAKSRFGLGRYFRGQHELCLFAVKGRGFSNRTAVNNVSTLIGRDLVKPTQHSSKPAQMYLELFARQQRPGWDAYGKELDDADET